VDDYAGRGVWGQHILSYYASERHFCISGPGILRCRVEFIVREFDTIRQHITVAELQQLHSFIVYKPLATVLIMRT
jgi:hypothetical protein